MKQLTFISLLLLAISPILAVPTERNTFIEVQPNGDTLNLSLRGDEIYSYIVTCDNIIVYKDTDGTWKHVIAENGQLKLGAVAAPPVEIKK